MTLIPLYGHEALQSRLAEAIRRGVLPSSLLLHGPAGVGKQRVGLWLAQLLLCAEPSPPCGRCQSCRYSLTLTHPDLHWIFAAPRPRDGDPTEEDRAAAIADRMANGGLYSTPSGAEAIYVGVVRSILRAAAMAPAIGRRKVFVIGDAERMAPQEGVEAAANAFLKLLEEPPADTTIILTSSVPGSLLPTIRSRVVALRVPHLLDDAVRAFVQDPRVSAVLKGMDLPSEVGSLVHLAAGAPGRLLAAGGASAAQARAARLFDAATRRRSADRYALALAAGAAKARASFSDTLEALAVTVHAQTRDAVAGGQPDRALAVSTTVDAVNRSAALAAANVNPQLITAALLRAMGESLS